MYTFVFILIQFTLPQFDRNISANFASIEYLSWSHSEISFNFTGCIFDFWAEPHPHFPSIFCSFLLWPNCWMQQDVTWHGGRPQPRGLCVRWGHSPSPKRGGSSQFLARVYCGQTAAWIKMPHGTEVGLAQTTLC